MEYCLEKKNGVTSGKGSWFAKDHMKNVSSLFPGNMPETCKRTSGCFNPGSLRLCGNINEAAHALVWGSLGTHSMHPALGVLLKPLKFLLQF